MHCMPRCRDATGDAPGRAAADLVEARSRCGACAGRGRSGGAGPTGCRRVGSQALSKQQVIDVDASNPCTVQGDATLLSVMVRNLVDNAIRYSPPGAIVKIAVSPEPGAVRLTVEDSGPGMSPTDMERIGERFFRVVGSGEDGSGLGWSITRRIAAVHLAVVRVAKSDLLEGLSVESVSCRTGGLNSNQRARGMTISEIHETGDFAAKRCLAPASRQPCICKRMVRSRPA